MLSGGSVSPWRSGVEEGRSPLGRFRKPEPCFPRTYATWDAKKDENRFGSVKFRLAGNLRDPSRFVRWSAIECLGGLRDVETSSLLLDELTKRTRDRNRDVREAACRVIGRLGSE